MPDQDTTARRWPNGAAATDRRTTPAHIARIHTCDPDEHRAWLATRYTDHRRTIRPRSHGFGFVTEFGQVGDLAVGRFTYTAATTITEWPTLPCIVAGRIHAGRYRLRQGSEEVRFGKHDALLLPLDGGAVVNDCCRYTSVRLALNVLLRVAEEETGLDRSLVRFTGVQAISAAARRQWLATVEFVRRGIYRRDLDPPLLLAAAEQAVAASLLATFPNTTMTTEQRRPRDPATPATVRRAAAYIDEHAGEPISVSDIAVGAGVTPRTLQAAFRRHRDTTAGAYLRRVRLTRAHEDLAAAGPGDGSTVATVAARWGFAHPRRFAAAYRQAYGRAPSRTLRS
ncbi:helix-turn-helix transcriptional regulator [Krasilnikovia sp. MM14-A1259]|uniref:helix-turn-helix transcriptional regulator n=1 Tax=Krasilnikovia sp. MM14-A1259 TaxID=3373539 RepID=UPI00381BF23F